MSAEQQARVDELRAAVASYGGGDRPSAPPVSLLRELRAAEEARAEVESEAPLDIASLRSLARSADRRHAEFVAKSVVSGSTAIWKLNEVATDVPALASAVERLADALEAKAPPRAQLDADELAIIERTRALVRGRDELRAVLTAVGFPQQGGEDLAVTFRRAWEYCVETAHKAQEAQGKAETERDEQRDCVDLLDEKGREMKAERDEARAELIHYTTLLRESAPDIDKALEGSKPPDLKDHNAWTIYAFIATLTGLRKMEEARTQQRDEARAEASRLGDLSAEQQFAIARAEAEIERMKPLVEAARAAERHITELEESSPINSGALIDLRAALETLDGGAS